MALADFSLPTGGFIQGKRVNALLQSILGDITFPQLKCIFACTTTDVITGEEVILRDGSLIEAIRASISLPGIFKPVVVKGRYLVDGGLLNEVPVNVCRSLGADYVIGVNVIPAPNRVICKTKRNDVTGACELAELNKAGFVSERNLAFKMHLKKIEDAIGNFMVQQTEYRKDSLKLSGESVKPHRRPPTLWEVVRQSLAITQYHVAIENIKTANLAISPEIDDIGFWQFNRAAEAIKAGERTARIALRTSELLKSAVLTK